MFLVSSDKIFVLGMNERIREGFFFAWAWLCVALFFVDSRCVRISFTMVRYGIYNNIINEDIGCIAYKLLPPRNINTS